MKKLETYSEEIEEKKYRHFMFLLYEDSSSYNFEEVLFDLKGSFKNYAYIKHTPEDSEKKLHYHFILSLDNTRTLTGLSKRIGVPSQFIQPIKGLRASCRYLTHIDSEDKIQYSLTEVIVSKPFTRKFFGAYDDLKTEEDIIDDIYNYIDTLDLLTFADSIKKLIMFVNSNSYDTIYKRYRFEFQDYLKLNLK